MQRIPLKIVTVILFLDLAVYGQSLADIARQYKEKQDSQQSTGAKPKVITNQDLGEGPDGRPDLRVERRPMASVASNGSLDPGFAPTNQRTDNPFGPRQGQRHWQQQGPMQQQRQGQHQEAWSGQGPELQRPEMQGNGEQWKERVLEQESKVASMQARIDQMNASARSGGASAQGPYNRYQARQMERVTEMQQQLDEQRRKLEMMQDAARRQGMHTQVYDP